ncbi:MAG: class I SAM-dependent methyltransferase [Rhodospirillales bacterium]|nr:class I SAM-dependent methyltransferase [Rhodospirillales bacterium]
MGIYQDWVLPRLIALTMRQKQFGEMRARLVPAAEGRVLEVGMGSGLNLPFYGPGTTEIFGLEPSPALLRMAGERARRLARPVRLLPASAEDIPLDAASIDTVVTTWTLCSIPDAARALGEMRRVLRPGGRLLFIEHGRAPDAAVRAWQDRLTPLWRRCAGNCHLNRPIDRLIEGAGFRLDHLETGYRTRGPRLVSFLYEGSARPR